MLPLHQLGQAIRYSRYVCGVNTLCLDYVAHTPTNTLVGLLFRLWSLEVISKLSFAGIVPFIWVGLDSPSSAHSGLAYADLTLLL